MMTRRDYYRSCIHEAGHFVVGEALGKRGGAILLVPHMHCHFAHEPDPEDWAPDDRIIVAVAGGASEILFFDSDPHSPASYLADLEGQCQGTNEIVSPGDLALAEGFELRHIERAFALLQQNQMRVIQIAQDTFAQVIG